METYISPQPLLDTERKHSEAKDDENNRKALNEQVMIEGRNITIKPKRKGCQICEDNEAELYADDQERAVLLKQLSVPAHDPLK